MVGHTRTRARALVVISTCVLALVLLLATTVSAGSGSAFDEAAEHGVEESVKDHRVEEHRVEEHRVEAGDTLSKIADRHGIGLEELLAANEIEDPNLLRVGQVLRVGGAAAATPEPKAEPPDFAKVDGLIGEAHRQHLLQPHHHPHIRHGKRRPELPFSAHPQSPGDLRVGVGQWHRADHTACAALDALGMVCGQLGKGGFALLQALVQLLGHGALADADQ